MPGKIPHCCAGISQRTLNTASAARFPCIRCSNTATSLSQNDFRQVHRKDNHRTPPLLTRCQRVRMRETARRQQQDETRRVLAAAHCQPRVPAGQGVLPTPAVFAALTTLPAELIKAALQLITPAWSAVAMDNPTGVALQQADGAFTRIINQFLPWHMATATPATPVVATPATLTVAATVAPLPADTVLPAWRIHQAGDNSTLFRQQTAEFIQRMNWLPDVQQQLMTLWRDQDLVFIYPAAPQPQRPERAHVDEMRRRTWLAELAIRDKTLAEGGVGAKIIAWADKHTEMGYTLFRKGVDSYNPLYFFASGGEVLIGYIANTAGEIYSGRIVERQPGESHADWLQRLTLNLIMPPEAAAAKAFAAKPVRTVRPLFTPAARPVSRLPGTVISHPSTGMALHSILQSEIVGQRWHLYPLGAGRAMAIPSGVHPTISHVATRSLNNLWQIEGVAGEHSFVHGNTPQWFILSGDLFYPVEFSAEESMAELSDGQKIYFHELSGQWKRWDPINPHLHGRVLAILPEGLSHAQLDAQTALASVGPEQAQVWSAVHSGEQYLIVRGQPDSEAYVENFYVAGRLEGDFFTVKAAESQPIYRQTVLKWQAQQHRWCRTESPFALLQAAEEHVDLSWLEQLLEPQTHLITVHNRPGLYRFAKEYFLRWQTDARGVDWFMPLLTTDHPLTWRTPQAGAEYHCYFRYQPSDASWQFLPFTSEAFTGIPPALKVRFTPPLTTDITLPEYRHLFFHQDAIWLHTGADSLGQAEYIRVEQDLEDNNLFSLKVGAEGEPDSLRFFRYDEDNEFVAEDNRLCPARVRRGGDEEPCAGPSGIRQNDMEPLQPPKKKMVQLSARDAEAQIWLLGQARTAEELLRIGDSRVTKARKNLTFALRLQMWTPATVSLNSIARYAGVKVRRLSAILGQLTPEGCYWLISHPPYVDENDVDYALRLYQLHEGLTPRIISEFTGVREHTIVKRLKQTPFDTSVWLRLNPRHPMESNIDYAVRLYRLPEGASRVHFIANHAGVDELLLRLRVDTDVVAGQSWLNDQQRKVGESDMEYALRLYHLPHEHVTIEMVSRHTGVDKVAFLQRLGRKWKDKQQDDESREWLMGYPRFAKEANFDYALRLTELRDRQVEEGTLVKKTVRNNIIAMHAHIAPRTFASRLYEMKITRQWCNNHPRQPGEVVSAEDSIDAATDKNRRYAMRLLELRYHEPTQKLKKIKNSAIAELVGISEIELNIWLQTARFEWFAKLPRLENEVSFENSDDLAMQRNNQLYARRLTSKRDQDRLEWLISELHIASYADVTLYSYKLAQDPLFEFTKPRIDQITNTEFIWQPESGLLHLQLKQNPPLLTDPKDPLRSVTKEVIREPLVLSNINEALKALPKTERQQVGERFFFQVQQLVDTDGGRQDFFYDEQGNKQPGLLSEKLQIYHNEQEPQLGLQIIAKEDFDPYELVGIYTGTWHPDADSLREECRKMGSQSVHTYLWGAYKGDESVSGYQNPNKLSLINTAELKEDDTSETKQQNNLAVLYVNDLLPAYYTTTRIAKGEPLLISYGNYYQADYMIQAALQNDVVRIIARERNCYFIIKALGEQNSGILGPEGWVASLPAEAQPYILQERLDRRGILRYDALYKKSNRKIAVSMDDENNLYHAMAKAMHPRGGLDIINEEIIRMKKSVEDEHARESGIIKSEPAEPAGES